MPNDDAQALPQPRVLPQQRRVQRPHRRRVLQPVLRVPHWLQWHPVRNRCVGACRPTPRDARDRKDGLFNRLAKGCVVGNGENPSLVLLQTSPFFNRRCVAKKSPYPSQAWCGRPKGLSFWKFFLRIYKIYLFIYLFALICAKTLDNVFFPGQPEHHLSLVSGERLVVSFVFILRLLFRKNQSGGVFQVKKHRNKYEDRVSVAVCVNPGTKMIRLVVFLPLCKWLHWVLVKSVLSLKRRFFPRSK